jgi:predicted transcriptional regulator
VLTDRHIVKMPLVYINMKISIQEKQDIEFKEKWHDKYLEWVCGFANAKGGKILIGVNDNKEIIGVRNSKKLLEGILSKIKDYAGGVQIDFFKVKPTDQATDQVTQHADSEATSQIIKNILSKLELYPLSLKGMIEISGLKDRIHFNNTYLKKMLDAELIEMTIPDKPKSPNQKYKITSKGKSLL